MNMYLSVEHHVEDPLLHPFGQHPPGPAVDHAHGKDVLICRAQHLEQGANFRRLILGGMLVFWGVGN